MPANHGRAGSINMPVGAMDKSAGKAVCQRREVQRVADWAKIKREYVTTDISTRALAEKHGVSYGTLRDRAKREGWASARMEHRSKVVANTEQKTAEKIADTESEVAAIRSRVHLKLMQEVERQTDALMSAEECNSYDLRRIVQSYRDMSDIVYESIGNEEQHNDLIDAIRARRKQHD